MAILCNVNYTNWANDVELGNTSCVCLELDLLQIGVEPQTTSKIDKKALIAAGVPLGGAFEYDGKNFYVNGPPVEVPLSTGAETIIGYFYTITRFEDTLPSTPPPTPPPTIPPTPPPTTTTCNPCYPFVPTTLAVPPPVAFTTRTIAPMVMITTTPPPISPLTVSIVTTSTTVAPSTTSTTSTTTISPTTVPPSLIQPCKSGCNTLNF